MKLQTHFFALALVTIVLMAVYGSVQQTYRTGANDPQYGIAEEIREKWERGIVPPAYFSDTVRLERSLSTFAIIYDSTGRALHAGALLNGQVPQLPKGVLKTARYEGSDWLTWQPQHNLRIALGVLRARTNPVSYIAVGRSMRVVEERSYQLRLMMMVAWGLCVFVICAHGALVLFQSPASEDSLL